MAKIRLKFINILTRFSYQLVNYRKLIIFLLITSYLFYLFLNMNSKPSVAETHYDDKLVNTSHYLEDYNERMAALSSTIEQRNGDNKKNKIVIKEGRQLGEIEYFVNVYTTVFGEPKFCTNNDLYLSECPHQNCQFSCDKSKVFSADAVLFSERDLTQQATEASYEIKKILQNNNYNRNKQVWILWNDEPTISPKMSYYNFNWTMTYRIDAEVNDCSYGCSYRFHNENKTQYESFVVKKSRYLRGFYERKHKAIWAVSNCHATKRMEFAMQLNKHMPVSVIGKCANYFTHSNSWIPLFFRNTFFDEAPACSRNSECELEKFRSAKFYLSFESYDCMDYLTEKIWRILRTDMIPIVLQPSKANYNLILPPDSFIHAEDFDYDARKLADYLELLSVDFELYMKHHAWKLKFDTVFTARQAEQRRLCELCTKLNTESSIIYYKDIAKWFNMGCKK